MAVPFDDALRAFLADSGAPYKGRLERMLRELYPAGELDASRAAQNVLAKAAQIGHEGVGAAGDCRVDLGWFGGFAARYPALLYPLHRFQGQLRSRVLGRAFWVRKRRAWLRRRNAAKAPPKGHRIRD